MRQLRNTLAQKFKNVVKLIAILTLRWDTEGISLVVQGKDACGGCWHTVGADKRSLHASSTGAIRKKRMLFDTKQQRRL
jgi:hypothetical protein